MHQSDYGVKFHAYQTFTLGGLEFSSPWSGTFILKKRSFNTDWIGGWVGPRTMAVEEKIQISLSDLKPGHPASSQ
jgi:hypothetical protein